MESTSFHSQAPISTLLSKLHPLSKNELNTLCMIASIEDKSSLTNIILPNTIAEVFNQSTIDKKRQCIIYARHYLGDYIKKLDAGTELNDLSLFLHSLINATLTPKKRLLIEDFGSDAILRTAMVNPKMAILAFEVLLMPLATARKQWLYFSLNSEQLIKQIAINQNVFNGPKPEDSDQPLIAQLIMLYYHWPSLRSQFKQTIDQALICVNKDTLAQTELTFSTIIENLIEENFIPFISTFNPVKPSNLLTIQQEIAAYSAEELAWLTLHAYALDMPQDTHLSADLAKLISKHGRQALLSVLHEKNTPPLNQKVLACIETELDNLIKGLTYNARSWLFLSLLLEDHTECFPSDITIPTGSELALCQKLCHLSFNCPIMTRLLHQRLSCRLPKGEAVALFNVICNYVHYSASTLNDQMRLWQTLSLITASEPTFFSMMPVGAHEKNLGNIIHRTTITPLSLLYQRMANYSSYLRKTIYDALQTNYFSNPGFEKDLSQLTLYQNHHLQTQLKRCDQNGLYWLYFTLLTNMQMQQPLTIADKFTISKPINRAWQQVEEILALVAMSPETAKLILNEIEHLIPGDKTRALKTVNYNFLQAKVNKLSLDARKWLYYALKTYRVANSFQLSEHTILTLPQDAKNDIAKIFYAIHNNVDLIPVVKECLLEKNPELAPIQPENDLLRFFALNQCSLGEFTYYESLSEEQSLALLPLLLKSTAKATKHWLKHALMTGVIDSNELLQALPSDMSREVVHELTLIPNIVVLALKYSSVRNSVIQECGGDIQHNKPLSKLVLDRLNFSEKGMIALALGLASHTQYLTHFSALNTNLSNDALIMLSTLLIGKAPLKILQVHHNPLLSSQALISLLSLSNERIAFEQQTFLCSTLIGYLQEPDILSWLSLKLNIDPATPLGKYIHNLPEFYTETIPKDKILVGNALFEHCQSNPHMKANVCSLLKFIMTSPDENNQLVYGATTSQDPNMVYASFQHIMGDIKNPKLNAWLKACMQSGKIEISEKQRFTEQELNSAVQLSCLLLVSKSSQRFALSQQLGIRVDKTHPNIAQVNIHPEPSSPILKSALAHAQEKFMLQKMKALSISDEESNEMEMAIEFTLKRSVSTPCFNSMLRKAVNSMDTQTNHLKYSR